MRIRVLLRGGNSLNAIDQASVCLCDALAELGHDARPLTRRSARGADEAVDGDVLIVPYNPFMWGRWGFAPSLLVDVARLRFVRRSKVVLLVHEPYVPIHDWRSFLMGAYQRAQLLALVFLAHRRLASIEAWSESLSRLRHTGHLPSGSNVPDRREAREAVRNELGIGRRVVIGSLSTGHSSYLAAHVEAAVSKIVGQGQHAAFLALGAGAPELRLPVGTTVHRPGMVSAERLGALVAACDIFLVPLIDGVSTRRGSLMAALCQGTAVVGTLGPLTDRSLTQSSLTLVDVDAVDDYASAVADLAADPVRREAQAREGRRLFEREFSWHRIAEKLMAEIMA